MGNETIQRSDKQYFSKDPEGNIINKINNGLSQKIKTYLFLRFSESRRDREMKKIKNERKMFHKRSTRMYLRNKKLKQQNQKLLSTLEAIEQLTKMSICDIVKIKELISAN